MSIVIVLALQKKESPKILAAYVLRMANDTLLVPTSFAEEKQIKSPMGTCEPHSAVS